MTAYIARAARTDWASPQAVFDALHARFDFTIDVAADASNAKCPRYYDLAKDGLAQSWQGERVWCNPPYGRGLDLWVRKAFEEASTGQATVVLLLPARTDTKWFHEYILPHAEIEFVQGRLRFGGHANAAPFPSMIAIFDGASAAALGVGEP